MTITLGEMSVEDWPAVQEIYRQGIETGHATFETRVPVWSDWDRKHRAECRLVARRGGRVVGWAALSPVSTREVYAGVAEVSVYVEAASRGGSIGKQLLNELVTRSEMAGIWMLQAGIFPENGTSISLHKACGFREVGIRRRIAALAGVWRDVTLLERRSETQGQ
jgi:phosphinothricin acetyltransferase